MFKIKTGNVGMDDNKLVSALLESKNQIKIFYVAITIAMYLNELLAYLSSIFF